MVVELETIRIYSAFQQSKLRRRNTVQLMLYAITQVLSPFLWLDRCKLPNNRDCDALFDIGMSLDGVYTINIRGTEVKVQCNFQYVGHNWIVSFYN